jgi:hypothetical protein
LERSGPFITMINRLSAEVEKATAGEAKLSYRALRLLLRLFQAICHTQQ